jgi:hypothetical protein
MANLCDCRTLTTIGLIGRWRQTEKHALCRVV